MGKQVRLSEDALRNIIMENVKKALKESNTDVVDSGLADYQGTGTPESKERVKKIRDKRRELGPDYKYDASFEIPAKNIRNIGKTTYNTALRSFGGRGAKSVSDSFKELVRPLRDKISALPKGSPQQERMWDLYFRLESVYDRWAKENKGASNGPSEKSLDEAIDRAVRKALKEMRGDLF